MNPGTDKGFTVIEIITVIIVLSVLGLFTFAFLDHAIAIYTKSSSQRTIYQEASYMLERMTRELRDMSNPATWTNGTTYDTLQFTRSHATLLDSATSVTFRRDTATNVLYRDGSVSRPMGSNVTAFTVVRAASGCSRYMDISLTLQKKGESITFTSRVNPKNLGSSSYNDRCFNGDYEDLIQ